MALTERELVRVLLHFPQYIDQAAERLSVEDFQNPVMRGIFGAIIAAGADAGPEQFADGLEPAQTAELERLLAESGGLDRPEEMVASAIARLGTGRMITARMAEIDRELPLADDGQKDLLIAEKQRLRSEAVALGIARYKAVDAKSR
jgi:hypothetical protein